jgi:hypothetical protein
VFGTLKQRIADLTEQLQEQAGLDPQQDLIRSTAIKAYRDLISIDYEEDLNGN